MALTANHETSEALNPGRHIEAKFYGSCKYRLDCFFQMIVKHFVTMWSFVVQPMLHCRGPVSTALYYASQALAVATADTVTAFFAGLGRPQTTLPRLPNTSIPPWAVNESATRSATVRSWKITKAQSAKSHGMTVSSVDGLVIEPPSSHCYTTHGLQQQS